MNGAEERTIIAAIRDILAELYPTEARARRVASDSGLNLDQIEFNDSAKTFWHAILQEARKSDAISDVLRVAQAEYPNNKALLAACDNYQRLQEEESENGEITSPGSMPVGEPSKKEFPLELPYGTVFPTSSFYIERDADRNCILYFQQGRAVTVFVKGPGQVGKSSLMQRINYLVKQKQDVAIAYVNLGRFESPLFGSLEPFLIEFCRQIGDALNISDGIDHYWSTRRGSALAKCSNYMTDHILSGVSKPLILAIDEMGKLLDAPFRNNFFGMLRTWHNDRAYDPKFQRLSLFLSSSTEPHLLIDNPTQSPFNVAQPVELNDFTLDEVRELNQRYSELLSKEQVMKLMDLLNGHPFFTRLALNTVATPKGDLETLFKSASTEESPFYAELSRFWRRISASSELISAVRQICRTQNYPENPVYYRLKGAGLIRRINGNVVMRNKLYERFFAERLGIAG